MAANAVNYQVIGPNDVYLGRTPGEWMSEFMGWLFSINPDQHNSGPVVFLKPFPYERTPDYPVRNEPNLMIGKDKLQIFTDQPIMIPVLLSYWATNDPNETETMMRERIRSDMINSDELRKDQITIDGNSIEIDEDIKDYLIESPLFTLSVPEDEYTKSVANMVDWPVMPGVNQSVATAYIFIVKFP
ncbi:MAG TPA: hypothetical protein VI278_06345, partial [Nitrososphaeraceae archaeon]